MRTFRKRVERLEELLLIPDNKSHIFIEQKDGSYKSTSTGKTMTSAELNNLTEIDFMIVLLPHKDCATD